MESATAVSYSFKHRPREALQTAIWWVEYVAHTAGAPLIKPAAVKMSRFVYYSLDIYCLIGGILLLSLSSWYIILKLIFGGCKVSEKIKTN